MKNVAQLPCRAGVVLPITPCFFFLSLKHLVSSLFEWNKGICSALHSHIMMWFWNSNLITSLGTWTLPCIWQGKLYHSVLPDRWITVRKHRIEARHYKAEKCWSGCSRIRIIQLFHSILLGRSNGIEDDFLPIQFCGCWGGYWSQCDNHRWGRKWLRG